MLTVSPILVPNVSWNATRYLAKQVRWVEPNSGLIHFLDGSQELFSSNSGGTYPSTFVPSANAGNVVPNPGDWLLTPRSAVDPVPAVPGGPIQPGKESLAQQFGAPGVPAAVFGAWYYYTNAQFQANFQVNYTEGLNVNQIVP